MLRLVVYAGAGTIEIAPNVFSFNAHGWLSSPWYILSSSCVSESIRLVRVPPI